MIPKGTAIVIVIVIGAGALSGLMYASLTAGNIFSLVFVFFAPLPLFAAGLAFGLTSAIVAIAAGVALSAVVGGPFDIPLRGAGLRAFSRACRRRCWCAGRFCRVKRAARPSGTRRGIS